VYTTSLNPSIIDSTPACSSQVDVKPSTPSIISSTSARIFNLAEIPLSSITVNQTDNADEVIESLKHDDDIELEILLKPKPPIFIPKTLSPSASTLIRPMLKINKANVKRTLSTANTINLQRRKRIGLTPLIIDNRRYIHRDPITPPGTETTKKKDKFSPNQIIANNDDKDEKISSSRNLESPSLIAFN
jgi:hypothetical protein